MGFVGEWLVSDLWEIVSIVHKWAPSTYGSSTIRQARHFMYIRSLKLGLFLSLTALAVAEPPRAGMVLWISAADAVVKEGVVVSILDRSGQGNDATRREVDGQVPANPALIADSVSGQPLLRFDGSTVAYNFPALSDIRTIFWVVSRHPDAFKKHTERFVLAGRKSADFHVGTHFTDTIIHREKYASPHLLAAHGWFNGFSMDPKTTEFTPVLGVTTLMATGNVSADQLAMDREYKERCWLGDIAEVILYNTELSAADRQAVETYLLTKYQIKPTAPIFAPAPPSPSEPAAPSAKAP